MSSIATPSVPSAPSSKCELCITHHVDTAERLAAQEPVELSVTAAQFRLIEGLDQLPGSCVCDELACASHNDGLDFSSVTTFNLDEYVAAYAGIADLRGAQAQHVVGTLRRRTQPYAASRGDRVLMAAGWPHIVLGPANES